LSYASDMKKELTLIEITQDREFLSELSALIKMNGILTIANGRLSLSFQTENASIARRMYSLIKYFYKVHINISVRKKLKLKKLNITKQNSEKLIELFKNQEKVSCANLADYLNISERTANRLLLKLEENSLAISNLIKINRGRPKKIYTFSF